MIYGQVQVQTPNQQLVFSLYDEIPEPDEIGLKIIGRQTLSDGSDITLYQTPSGIYVVTLYNTSSEVIWGISDDPVEALDTAMVNMFGSWSTYHFGVLEDLLKCDEDAKMEAEKVLKEYKEFKEAFYKLQEVAVKAVRGEA